MKFSLVGLSTMISLMFYFVPNKGRVLSSSADKESILFLPSINPFATFTLPNKSYKIICGQILYTLVFYYYLLLLSVSVGVRTRSRNLLREAVRPHGQCLSDLKQSEACVLQACFTFSSSSIVASEAPSGSVKCIRSDGLIVEGE